MFAAGAASGRPRWGSGLVTAISSTGRWDESFDEV